MIEAAICLRPEPGWHFGENFLIGMAGDAFSGSFDSASGRMAPSASLRMTEGKGIDTHGEIRAFHAAWKPHRLHSRGYATCLVRPKLTSLGSSGADPSRKNGARDGGPREQNFSSPEKFVATIVIPRYARE